MCFSMNSSTNQILLVKKSKFKDQSTMVSNLQKNNKIQKITPKHLHLTYNNFPPQNTQLTTEFTNILIVLHFLRYTTLSFFWIGLDWIVHPLTFFFYVFIVYCVISIIILFIYFFIFKQTCLLNELFICFLVTIFLP